MSLKYIDHNGAPHDIAGLSPGGNIEMGAVATRQGTITIPSLAANTVTTTEITFSEPMPDNNYEVTFTVSSLSGPQGGSTLFMPFSKTPNGFVLAGYNGNSAVVAGTTLVWKAFKLYEVADAEQLYSKVTDIETMVPSNASSTNKFATINDLTGETRSLDRRIDDLEDYMPSNVSISNKVATQADLANVSIDELGDIEDVDLNDLAEGQTLVWDSTNSKWVNGAGGKTYTAGDGINISGTDEISTNTDNKSVVIGNNKELKVADTYKTIFVGTRAQWDALSTADKVKYNEAHITDDVIGGEVADEVTDGLMSPVTSNAVYDYPIDSIADGQHRPPTSNAVYDGLANKQDKLTGTNYTFTSQNVNFSGYTLRKTGNIVVFCFNMSMTPSAIDWITCGTLPTAVRPSSTVYGAGTDAWNHPFIVHITAAGLIQVYPSTTGSTSYCYCNLAWII